MHHADAFFSHQIDGILHIGEQFNQRQRSGNIIRELEKSFLIHLARIRMVAAEILHFAVHFGKEF